MTSSELGDLLNRTDVQRRILGDYDGPYSLGVTRCPNGPSGLGFVLRIANEPPRNIPDSITIDSLTIPILVLGGFRAPRASAG